MAQLLRRPNLFGFPGGAPGFDPSHPAARHERVFSAVPAGANFVNLTSGASGSLTGSPTYAVKSTGPSVHFSTTNASNFSGQSTTQTSITMACIVTLDAVLVGFYPFLANDSGSAGVNFSLFQSQIECNYRSGTNFVLLASPAANVPYFIAYSASHTGTTADVFNAIVINLKTGAIVSSIALTAQNVGALNAPNGTFSIGTANGTAAQHNVSAAMIGTSSTKRALTIAELTAWGQGPWAFWYPNKLDLMQTLGQASAAAIPTSFQFQQPPTYRKPALPDVSQPLNLNLFKNPVPNNQFDWSLPIRVPHITPDASWPTNPNLFKNPIPNNQTDWSPSRRLPDFLPDSSVSLNLNLFKNPIPNNQFDWSKPLGQLPLPAPIHAYNNALYTVVVVAAPFNQTDWAVPRRLMALPLPPDTLNTNLFTNPVPFNQFDWLKPFRVPLALAQPSPPLNINVFTNPIPFFQTDWATPIRQRPLPGPAQPFNPNLYGVVTVSLPFNQTDWTPARRPLPRLSDDPPNFQLLVSVAPGAPPELHSKPFFATPGQLMGM